MIFFFNKKAMT